MSWFFSKKKKKFSCHVHNEKGTCKNLTKLGTVFTIQYSQIRLSLNTEEHVGFHKLFYRAILIMGWLQTNSDQILNEDLPAGYHFVSTCSVCILLLLSKPCKMMTLHWNSFYCHTNKLQHDAIIPHWTLKKANIGSDTSSSNYSNINDFA